MSTWMERARKRGEERDQMWLQRGIERGIEWGIEHGIERERELLARMVRRRFGRGTVVQFQPVLERLSEQEDMALVAYAVIECETAEEFFRWLGDD